MTRKATGAREGEKMIIEPTEQAEESWALTFASKAYVYAGLSVCIPNYCNKKGSKAATTPEEQLKTAKGAPWCLRIVDARRTLEVWEARGDLIELDVSSFKAVYLDGSTLMSLRLPIPSTLSEWFPVSEKVEKISHDCS
jgi:hypothetical protein